MFDAAKEARRIEAECNRDNVMRIDDAVAALSRELEFSKQDVIAWCALSLSTQIADSQSFSSPQNMLLGAAMLGDVLKHMILTMVACDIEADVEGADHA